MNKFIISNSDDIENENQLIENTILNHLHSSIPKTVESTGEQASKSEDNKVENSKSSKSKIDNDEQKKASLYKEYNSINGLNLLCDPKKKKNLNLTIEKSKLQVDIKKFSINIDDFKSFFTKKIEKFSIQSSNNDYYNNIISSAYYHYLFEKIDKNKLSDFINENTIN